MELCGAECGAGAGWVETIRRGDVVTLQVTGTRARVDGDVYSILSYFDRRAHHLSAAEAHLLCHDILLRVEAELTIADLYVLVRCFSFVDEIALETSC